MGFNGTRVRNRWGGLTVSFPRGIMVAQDKEVGELHERFRRLAAGGWLDILALVLAVVVIVVLSICTNLDDVAEAISKPSTQGGANYGGALVAILAVFAVFVVTGELALGGAICAAAGISILIGGKKCADARPISRIRSGIAVDAVFLVLNGSTLFGAVFLLFSKWSSAVRAAVICSGAALLVCLGLALAFKAADYSRRRAAGRIYEGE